ncbi:uncharacterized protein [Trachinotus anak]|uniref:uncharacterized protein isoform X2 n=1 Tax=Trachinotus anak TaxID=443729 RepID=UPI0039F1E049
MMVDFRSIKVFLFLTLALQFTVRGQYSSSIIVRAGGEATLSCGNVMNDPDKCDSTTWLFRNSRNIVNLVTQGQIVEDGNSKSDRLSVTENCSLVVKKVTAEDGARYDCQQYRRGQNGSYAAVYLSVVTMTEQKVDDDDDDQKVTLTCSVSTHTEITPTVKWLYEGKNVDEGNTDMKTSQSNCSAAVEFPSSHLKKLQLFQCEVTDGYTRKVQLFDFRASPSGEDTTSTTTVSTNPGHSRTESQTNTTVPAVSDSSTSSAGWLRLVIVCVGLTGLIVIVVTVDLWTRTKGNKTKTDDNEVQNDEDDAAVNYENV